MSNKSVCAAQKNAWENKYHIYDMETPRNEILSAQFKKSFAYSAVIDRLPVMLTHIIDHLTRNRDSIAEVHGEDSKEETKQIIARLAKLKYELQTDKNFLDLGHDEPDMEMWNELLDKLPAAKKTFFRACWLDTECYTYRKVNSFFTQSETLRTYDYFKEQKQQAAQDYVYSMLIITKISASHVKKPECLRQLFQLLAWSQAKQLLLKKDSNSEEQQPTGKKSIVTNDDDAEQKEKDLILNVLKEKASDMLIDQTAEIWRCLCGDDDKQEEATKTDNKTKRKSKEKAATEPVVTPAVIVDIVLNNAGYELFVSLMIAQFLVDKGLATQIRFHVKAMPWFVLDVMAEDVYWFLKFLRSQESELLKALGTQWTVNFESGVFQIAKPSYFWTTSHPYYKMREVNPELYNYLRHAKLVIFNGDLNYRKLLGDYSWDDSEAFITCIRGFRPSNICFVRSIRAKVVCGLGKIDTAALYARDRDWMSSGRYATIQYAESFYCGCSPDDKAIYPPYPYVSESKDSLESCDTKLLKMQARLEEEDTLPEECEYECEESVAAAEAPIPKRTSPAQPREPIPWPPRCGN